jgi:hypothetical protein
MEDEMGRTHSKHEKKNAQRVLVGKNRRKQSGYKDPDMSGRKTLKWICGEWVEWIEIIWFKISTEVGGHPVNTIMNP